MVASPSRLGRVGIIVPKHKHTGVERNRLKRRLRELVRTRLLPGLPAVDAVIRAMPHAYGARFEALAADIEHAARKIPSVVPPPSIAGGSFTDGKDGGNAEPAGPRTSPDDTGASAAS